MMWYAGYLNAGYTRHACVSQKIYITNYSKILTRAPAVGALQFPAEEMVWYAGYLNAGHTRHACASKKKFRQNKSPLTLAVRGL
jgi:hypothetical protein